MDEGLDVLVNKVERLLKVVAIGAVVGKAQGEQVDLLSRAGFQPKEIAELIGTTPNTVRVSLSAIRKARSGKRAMRTERKE